MDTLPIDKELGGSFPRHLDRFPVRGGVGVPLVDQCRRFVAEEYLKRGYISQDDITNGFIGAHLDPYVYDSIYFGAIDKQGEVDATARLIEMPKSDMKQWKFPIEEFELDPVFRDLIEYTKEHEPGRIIEFSAHAARNPAAVINIYKMTWQHSKKNGQKLWLIAADEELVPVLSFFGDAVIRAGEPHEHMGSMTYPMILLVDHCAAAMADHYLSLLNQGEIRRAIGYAKMIQHLKEGLSPRCFNDEERKALEGIGLKVD